MRGLPSLQFLMLIVPCQSLIALVCIVASLISAAAYGGGPPISEISDADQSPEAVPRPPTNSPLPLIPQHDTALVAAPDGIIYLVEINSKEIIWSFKSGPSIYSSHQALHKGEDAKNDGLRLSDNFFIDCGDDWELYMHGKDSEKVKLPLTAEELIKRTPFISPDGVMLGTKKTTVFLVDAKSGTVLHSFTSGDFPTDGDQSAAEKSILPRKYAEEWHDSTDADLEAVEQPLYVTRTDYTVKYSSVKTGQVLWYLMFAEIEASFQHQGIEKFFGGLSSEEVIGPEHNGAYQLPVHFQARPIVYRIRDRSSLDSIFRSERLLKSFPSNGALSIPAPDLKPALPGMHQNGEGMKLLALPSPKTENSGNLVVYRGDTGQIEIKVSPEYQAIAGVWGLVQFFVLLLSIVTLIFRRSHLAVRKKGKFNMQAESRKVQPVMSKKKKGRKSVINKNNDSNEKRQINGLRDHTIEGTSGHVHIDRTERKLELTFDSVGSLIDGRKIGKMLVSNKEIARGSNGTVVLEGIYDGRPVAVKRLVQSHHDVALKEIQNLIASDQHPNIVRWYGVEYDQDFIYISLERCTCTLHELILLHENSSQNESSSKDQALSSLSDCSVRLQWMMESDSGFGLWKDNGYPSPQLLKLMRDIVYGLAHLHELGIIHRDLKPQNVLILKERSMCAKVSDMGISKRLDGDTTSLTKQTTGYGSSGWQAPEQLLHERQTRGVDLFSLGCVLFFCITGGKHPYGDNLERDVNIVNNRKDLFLMENIPEGLDLVSRLLNPDPQLRPRAADVLLHPLFWDSEMRLSFLRDASDRVELEDREENGSELLRALEAIGSVAWNGKWNEKLENALINDIGRYRRYKFDSVRDLLRVIRNKLNHYRELPKEIQGILGQVPEEFEFYFSSRFPKLLIEAYNVLQRYCGEEEFLRKYFLSTQI